MQDHVTPNRIANAIMQKTSFKGSYLIVEGNNDYTLYKKFTKEEFCKVEIAFGNENVIEVINELQRRGYQDALGIIDSDFRILENDLLNNQNILLTDDHDIELMIFKSEAFDTIISHYSTSEKIESFKSENKNIELRDIFLNLAIPLGCLKWANKREKYGLTFKPSDIGGNLLNITEFIPVNTLKFISFEKMIQTVFNYSRNKSKVNTTQEHALESLREIAAGTYSPYYLCNGHDIIQIVCLSLRKKLASLNSNSLKPEDLEREMIFAYDSRHFEQTDLYKRIKAWETSVDKQLLKF